MAVSFGVHAQQPSATSIVEIKAPGIDRPLLVVDFDAPSIGRRTKYMALLPKDYENREQEHFPVLYMLHGLSQNYTVWPMLGIPQATAGLDLIVVMPDGGNAWYINWAESHDGQKNNWEDFIITDLINHVDSTFRTIPTRIGRAINGLSMGGFGAISLGLRNPGVFCSIGSHSGAIAFARNAGGRLEAGEEPIIFERENIPLSPMETDIPELIGIKGFTTQAERSPSGMPFKTLEECAAHDPFELVVKLPQRYLPHIYLDCGTSDSLMRDSIEFMQVLVNNSIPFTFAQSPGSHNPTYWTREVPHSVVVQFSIITRSLEAAKRRAARVRLQAQAEAASPADDQDEDAVLVVPN